MLFCLPRKWKCISISSVDEHHSHYFFFSSFFVTYRRQFPVFHPKSIEHCSRVHIRPLLRHEWRWSYGRPESLERINVRDLQINMSVKSVLKLIFIMKLMESHFSTWRTFFFINLFYALEFFVHFVLLNIAVYWRCCCCCCCWRFFRLTICTQHNQIHSVKNWKMNFLWWSHTQLDRVVVRLPLAWPPFVWTYFIAFTPMTDNCVTYLRHLN